MSRWRLFHWPGWRQLGYATLLGSAEMLLFLLVYGGANWLAGQHAYRVQLHLDADLAIPFVPSMTLAYLSLNPLMWLAPFILRTLRQIEAMVATMAVATLVAGVCFVLLPGEHAFAPPDAHELGIWIGADKLARSLALSYNYLPSLHVAFTVICLRAYSAHAESVARPLLAMWGGAIVASTLLVHQHYMLDVATGFMLGWGAVRLVYQPMIAGESRETEQTLRPTDSQYRLPSTREPPA